MIDEQDIRDGLLNLDPKIIKQIFDEFREPAIRAVGRQGCGRADGEVFFQVGLLEASNLLRKGQWSEGISFGDYIQTLAISHYQDWLEERGQILGSASTDSALTSDEQDLFMPDSASMRLTRRKIFAWKSLKQLSGECQKLLSDSQPTDHSLDKCLDEWKSALQLKSQPSDLGGEKSILPDWAEAARYDIQGFKLWKEIDFLDRQRTTFMADPPKPSKNGKIKAALIGLLAFGLIGLGIYRWTHQQDEGKVFNDHFEMPKSITEDLKTRVNADSIVPELPEFCENLLEKADKLYVKKDYTGAAEPLLDMLNDSSGYCQSEAYFYLGIIGLELERPEFAIRYFSKVEDLERFGEDVFWYQGLALVQMSETGEVTTDQAKRAMERALTNSKSEVRKSQAQNILQDLEK